MTDLIRQTILYSLVEICRTHRTRIDEMLKVHGIVSGQEMFLLVQWNEEGLTHAELAAQMRIQPSSITMILRRMEKAKLIRREQDAEDMRVWRVYLTEQGRTLHDNLQAVWMQAEQETTVGMTVEERVLLRRLLLHIYQNILNHS